MKNGFHVFSRISTQSNILHWLGLFLCMLFFATSSAWATGGTMSGSGSQSSPYVISDAADWNAFATAVNGGNSYANKFIKLDADISVSQKVGNYTQGKPFSGTFDGGGHIVTAFVSDASNGGTALFNYINGATIKNLTLAGNITGAIHAAGVVGYARGTGNRIEKCIVTATVSGSSHIGGILGHGLSSDIAIDSCVFKGKLVGGTTAKGVLFGWGDNGGTKSVTNSLYIMQEDQNTTGLDLAKMDAGSVTMTGCYKTTDVGGYGRRAYLKTPANVLSIKKKASDGTEFYIIGGSSSETPFVIGSDDDWNTFATAVNGGNSYAGEFFKLGADISVTQKVGDYTSGLSFSGTFDGDGHTITASISDASNSGTALFSSISGAIIKNLTLAGSVTGGIHAAALVGISSGTGNRIENCVVSASVSGTSHIGGILGHGRNSDITIDNCVFKGLLEGGTIAKGVLFGWGDNGGTKSVTNCFYIMQNDQNTDGLDLAKMSGGSVSVTDCYKTADVGTLGSLVVLSAPADGLMLTKTAVDGTTFYGAATISGVRLLYPYTGNIINISYNVVGFDGKALVKGTDYTESITSLPVKEKGSYTLIITAKEGRSYTGSKTFRFFVGDYSNVVDLSLLMGDYVAQNGEMLTGKLGGNYKISIADGATVTLDGVNINGDGNLLSGSFAGITCEGDCNIMLAEGSVNTVRNVGSSFSGIYVPEGKTLTIDGAGSLDATGGYRGAGIGGGDNTSCGNILIQGGSITATGGVYGAGIGGGYNSSCGNITITDKVTKVVAVSGSKALSSIGKGYGSSTVGTITIGGEKMNNIISGRFTYPRIPYSVAFYGNGGRGSMKNQTLYRDNDMLLNPNKFTREGYMFIDWNTKPDGSGTAYQDSAGVFNLANEGESAVLFAQWLKLTGKEVNLADLKWSYTAKDGEVLYGTFDGEAYPYELSIADGATVTLANVTVHRRCPYGDFYGRCEWPGIDCEGDCKIVLVGENKVESRDRMPGIFAPEGKTLIIEGDGKLYVKSEAAAIGSEVGSYGEYSSHGFERCGDIVINSGEITTVGFIGSPYLGSCGDITINGGSVSIASDQIGIGSTYGRCGDITINGGSIMASGDGVGIGTNGNGVVGNITINEGVTKFTAVRKYNDYGYIYSIGCERVENCGTITILGNETDGVTASPFELTREKYAVVFKSNGGTGSMASQTVYRNFKQRLDNNEFKRNGFVFMGWNTKEDGTGVDYRDGANVLNLAEAGGTVTLYAQWFDGDLSKLKGDFTATDGAVLYGTLDGETQPYKISIADGATVTLNGVTVNGVYGGRDGSNEIYYDWAGITCLGDCKIILAEGSENFVKGFSYFCPGIYIHKDHTLVIDGLGKLDAWGGGAEGSDGVYVSGAAGIGGREGGDCGNIMILGGDITAISYRSAGVGCGWRASCGDITIGENAKITAITTVLSPYSIGKAYCYEYEVCSVGKITIGGYETEGVSASPFVFPCGTYNIAFNANGGKGSMENLKPYLCLDLALSANTFTREGYTFMGWNTKPDGSGDTYANREKVHLTDNADETVTLYAQWFPFEVKNTVNLAELKGNYTATDGTELTGKLGGKYKISIADGATVMLNDVNIDGVPDTRYPWAGITCLGDCNIILADGSVNNVRGFCGGYAGVYVPEDHTLTIDGSGTLNASSNNGDYTYYRDVRIYDGDIGGSGIGGNGTIVVGPENSGNIVIKGGNINATGGIYGAGIGGGDDTYFGNITISGGTVNATGGRQAAGIGGGGTHYYTGYYNDNKIVITDGVKKVVASSVGAGSLYGKISDDEYQDYLKRVSLSITIFGNETSQKIISPFKFTGESYTVVFDKHDGSGTELNQKMFIGFEQQLKANTWDRDDATFTGWNTEPDGSGTAYADGAMVNNLTDVDGGTVKLYAQWIVAKVVKLDTLQGDYLAHKGDRLTGTLADNYKISIADKATVTLDGVSIKKNNFWDYSWAGLTCEGDCNILLAENSENVVKSFQSNYPGIFVPRGKTLVIGGKGSLDAMGGEYGAGIGGLYGSYESCGNITILEGVARVTATKGESEDSPYNIGCRFAGKITIGGHVTESIVASPFTYPITENYTVVFDKNKGEGTMENQVLYRGLMQTLNSNVYTREGLLFAGWNTAEDGSGSAYADGENVQDLAADGDQVTLYAQWFDGDLSKLKSDFVAHDGEVLTGTLAGNYKISIADKATVTLNGAVINGVVDGDRDYPWAGITCLGDCNILLAEGSENTVKYFHYNYPGIFVPEGYTLTIDGKGALDAMGGGDGAGIGCGTGMYCGNIVINGGNIVASGENGIGSGWRGSCGDISISGEVTKVTASGYPAIGKDNDDASVGTITIGGVVTGTIGKSPYTYEPYSVEFYANDGSGSMKRQYINRGEESQLDANTFTRDGYTIAEWNTKPDGSGDGYLDGAKVKDLAEGGKALELYAQWWNGDLAMLKLDSGNYVAKDGFVLRGTLASNSKVSIADGATVTLDGANINRADARDYPWAGLTCLGDCNILLKEKSVNNVRSLHANYPGIYVPKDYTLTIDGKGKLDVRGASSSGYGSSYGGAGIGGGSNMYCGNIVIKGGDVVATGSERAAGIGGGGSGMKCGNITITEGVTRVTAIKGKKDYEGSIYSIGQGYGDNASVGKVTIGGVVTGNISVSPYTYPKVSYTVVFDRNGGEGTMENQTLYLGNGDQKLRANKFTRSGYIFAGWNTDADGKGEAFGDGANVLDLAAAGGKVVLYAQWFDGDLSKLKSDFVAHDGDVLYGTLDGETQPYKISIANNATVTLNGASINGVRGRREGSTNIFYRWAGITCLGNCRILLADGSENAVTGFYENYPGIYIPEGYTLTIGGRGKIDVRSGSDFFTYDNKEYNDASAAAIGGGYGMSCGNIVIESGDITATGGHFSAAIGGGSYGVCGDITIMDGAKVTATKFMPNSTYAGPYNIGSGRGGSVGKVTIRGVETGSIAKTPCIIPFYFVSIEDGFKNGEVKSDMTMASEGERVTLTITPDEGFQLVSLTVKDADGNDIEVTDNSFVMPASDVTVRVIFAEPSRIVLLDTLTKDYSAQEGQILTGKTNYTVKIEGANKVTSPVTLFEATINGGIKTVKNVEIVLEGANHVAGKENEAGISAPGSTSTLTIKGAGSLEAVGGTNGPGIGVHVVDGVEHRGRVVIEGGSITAIGNGNAAGIGTAYISRSVWVTFSGVTIKGGTVKATGYVGIGFGKRENEDDPDNEMGATFLYHGFNEVDATIADVKYMYGETDVTSNPGEYFAINGSKVRSLFELKKDKYMFNGSVVATAASGKSRAYADESVRLTATPDVGYKVDFFSVRDADGNEIEVDGNSFVMPTGGVTVRADFISKYPALTFTDNGKKVMIDGSYSGNEALAIEDNISVNDVVLHRSFSTAGYATITLPFGIKGSKASGAKQFLRFIGVKPNEQGVREVHMKRAWCDYDVVSKDIDAMNISNEDKEKAKTSCREVSGADVALSAYTPYVVQMKDNSLTFDVSAAEPVTLVKTPDEAETVVGNWVFRGTLAPKTWEPGDPEIGNAYGYMAGTGDFRKVGDNSSIGVLRSYLVYEKQTKTQTSANVPGLSNIRANFSTETLPANMNVVIVDDDENGKEHRTVIGRFNTRTGEFTPVLPENRTFDVKGRRVNETRSVGKGRKAKGVYYGRKK